MNVAKRILLYFVGAIVSAGMVYCVKSSYRWAVKTITAEPNIATREWVSEPFGSGEYSLSVPWHLEQQTMELPAEAQAALSTCESRIHATDELMIGTTYIAARPNTYELDMDSAADSLTADLPNLPSQYKNVVFSDIKKVDTSVLGRRAVQIEATGTVAGNPPMYYRAIVFGDERELYQVVMSHTGNGQLASQVWARLVSGLRKVG